MFKSICSKIKKVALAGLAVLGLTSTAMASETVSLSMPDLGWSSMASDILDYVTTGVLAALGIGLAIFGIRVVYRMFKSFAK